MRAAPMAAPAELRRPRRGVAAPRPGARYARTMPHEQPLPDLAALRRRCRRPPPQGVAAASFYRTWPRRQPPRDWRRISAGVGVVTTAQPTGHPLRLRSGPKVVLSNRSPRCLEETGHRLLFRPAEKRLQIVLKVDQLEQAEQLSGLSLHKQIDIALGIELATREQAQARDAQLAQLGGLLANRGEQALARSAKPTVWLSSLGQSPWRLVCRDLRGSVERVRHRHERGSASA